MMLKQTVKTVVVVATSVIAIPYAVAILTNLMYGWPRKDRYRRALHPKKVYALNYVVLQEIAKIRYLGLMLYWKYFYSTAKRDRIIKDLPYGNHDNKLDVYLPHDEDGRQVAGSKPVVVFVYGGTWGSGDKNMYGLLCSQLADKLKSVVCCPNYSTYPKGYVDDMVQDVVDCLVWIQKNADKFGGDKECVILSGHSAGGHLCVMSVLELTLKHLLHHPESVLLPLSTSPSLTLSRQSSIFSESIRFEEKYFNGNNASSSNGDNSDNLAGVTTTGSFYVVDDKNDKSFVVLDDEQKTEEKTGSEGSDSYQDNQEESEVAEQKDQDDQEEDKQQKKEVTFEETGTVAAGGGGDTGALTGEGEEVLTVEVTERGEGSVPRIEGPLVVDTELTQSQREARDILSSVKLVVGIAGVYQITEHYEHEAMRGVEDISTMAKAMYGPEHFDRLSPTVIVSELPDKIRLPPILLIHGDKDKTVPLSSSLKLAQALYNKGCYDVSISVIPDCGHTDVCLDLMEPSRPWYNSVMGEIMKGVNKCL